MCGINGILRLDGSGPPVEREELLRTRDAMASRGPDGQGCWVASDRSLGLGHRRLAIIDPSPAGAQPMRSEDGRQQIVFNGEIYNHRELRKELRGRGVAFRSSSDTEVILALYAAEGVAMLDRLRGMYALAVWDETRRTLLLARDPYGIKPLYYSETGGALRFASSVRALLAGGALPDDIDPAGLVGFLLWGSVPEPFSLRSAVRALPAGHHLLVREGRVEPPRPHYGFGDAALAAPTEVAEALADSVRAHLVSDVPVALFLSAGVDSGLVAALAQQESDEELTALTLTFEEYAGTEQDEGPLAAETARALGLRHVERRVRREEFLDLWPRALEAMDQPSIDGFNTFVVSKVAHEEGFKVALSGLGGDELLGGYDSFRDVPRWRRAASALRSVPGLRVLWPTLSAGLARSRPKLAGFLEHGGSLAGAYLLRRGLFLPQEIVRMLGGRMALEGLEAYDPVADASKFLGREAGAGEAWTAVHLMESTQYLRNQLLRDSDWASMAHSLELRVPLVDARLRAALLGAGFEPARSKGKGELARIAAPGLPAAVRRRSKTGFSIPVMRWIGEQADLRARPGRASRNLALKVLEYHGLPVAAPEGP
jgi:asparagine synthase (glutamine-hydrolysing)